MIGRTILILAPHPDDEVVGCAAAASRARADGHAVHVLFLTTGVPSRETLWPWQRDGHAGRVRARLAEADRAAAAVGIRVAGVLDTPARTLRHRFADARARVAAAIRELGADTLWVPAFEGGHQDHDAANAIAATLEPGVEVWEFAEYNFSGGRVRRQAFPDPTGAETVLALSDAERALKAGLLQIYRSEAANLSHVGLERECLRPLKARDYGRPPHPGRPFFARFQWVPFRHPRVDFTDPARVYAELGRAVAEAALDETPDGEEPVNADPDYGSHPEIRQTAPYRAVGG